MGSYVIPKEILKGITKSHRGKWEDIESKIAEGDLDLVVRKTPAGFLILELFNNKGGKIHEDKLDDPMPGFSNVPSKNLVSSLENFFKGMIFKEL